MAAVDLYQGPEFIEVYPVSTRLRLSGYTYMDSLQWPPETAPTTYIVNLVDDHPDVPHFGEVRFSGTPWGELVWTDEFQFAQVTADGEGTFNVAEHSWFWWDLAGIDLRQVSRAELIIDMFTVESSNPEGLDIRFSWAHNYTEYQGLPHSPAAFKSVWPGNAGPRINALDIAAISQNGDLNPYKVEVFSEGVEAQWGSPAGWYQELYAIPLSGWQTLPSGMVGMVISMADTTPPAGENFINIWCDMRDFADFPNQVQVGGFRVPHLRLWTGVPPVEIGASGAVRLTGSAGIAPPPRTPRFNLARWTRNRRG